MANKLQWIFLLMIGLSGYLWLEGESPNDAQLFFRVSLLVVGLLGFVISKLVATRASKDSK